MLAPRPASCKPIGKPSIGTLLPHRRAMDKHCLAAPVQADGKVNLPTFIVAKAIARPRPSCPIKFSAGTFTLVNLSIPLYIPPTP